MKGEPDPLRTQRLTGGQLPWFLFKVGTVLTLCLPHLRTPAFLSFPGLVLRRAVSSERRREERRPRK